MRLTSCLAFGLALTLHSGSARADIPPPDACKAAGEACNNAGNGGDQPGVCTTVKCTRALPSGPTEYPCNRCTPAPAKPAEPAPSAPVRPAEAAHAAKPVEAAPAKKSSCASLGGTPDAPALLAGLALLFGLRRARRARPAA